VCVDVIPPTRPDELLDTIRNACEALLGVSVAANELLGQTAATDSLCEVFDELGTVFPTTPDSGRRILQG
jgi:hypothetical protein